MNHEKIRMVIVSFSLMVSFLLFIVFVIAAIKEFNRKVEVKPKINIPEKPFGRTAGRLQFGSPSEMEIFIGRLNTREFSEPKTFSRSCSRPIVDDGYDPISGGWL